MNKQRVLLICLMRFTNVAVFQTGLIIFIISAAGVYANPTQELLERRVTLHVEATKLRTVLNLLGQKASVKFTYSSQVINVNRPTALSADNERLADVLVHLLQPFNIAYVVVGQQIILKKTSPNKPVETLPQSDQSDQSVVTPGSVTDVVVSGRMVDAQGQRLPGVNIVLKNTSRGTTSNGEGEYSISVPGPSAILVFSFVGYKRQEITVGNRTVLDVTLQADDNSLSEVVVTGYSAQQRRDITGAVASVDAKDLTAVPATNFAQQLQGRVAGVQVGTDGQPGGEVSVRIRGIGSITGTSDPLYIIDGVPTQGGLNQLNPNDIESLQILKDAASASIYGARASNGVVIITTKKGKAGKTQISLDTYTGFQQLDPSRIPKFVTLQQYADLLWTDARATGNVDPKTGNPVNQIFGSGATPVIPDYIVGPGVGVKSGDPRTDPSQYNLLTNPIARVNQDGNRAWYQALYRQAPISSINLSVSGASEKGRYALTAGYFDQQGILTFTGFKRYSLRVNTEFNVGNKVRIGENVQFSYTNDVRVGRYYEESPVNPAAASPFQPIFDINGHYTGSRQGNFYSNSYAVVERNKDNHNYNGRLFGNVYAEADLAKGLTARTTFGVDYTNGNLSNFQPAALESRLANQVAILTVSNSYAINWVWTNTLNYTTTLAEKHRLSVLGGTEAVNNKFRTFNVTKSDFAFEDIDYRTLDAAEKLRSASGGSGDSDSRLFSLFAKADYVFDDKYLLSATIRRDGSSRFAPSHRYGVFPAVSLGWRISQETFLKNSAVLNDLKLRASWGKTGNQEINPYNQYSTYATSLASSAYDINGTSNSLVVGYAPRKLGNPDAQWEAQTMTNVGLDATFLKGKVNLTLDAYNRISDKLLLNIPHPGTDGQQQFPAVNVGATQNKGIDVLLGYNGNGLKGQLRYGITANWSTYTNKVTALYAGDDAFIAGANDGHLGITTRTAVGHPVSSFYGYQIIGTFQTQEEAKQAPVQNGDAATYNQVGRWRYQDVNGDKVVNASDQTYIGNPIPKFTYGLNLTASYKGFDVTLFLQGVYGNDIFNALVINTDFGGPGIRALNYWTPTNTSASLPALNSLANPLEKQPSSYEVEKGSYLRAKNVQIGYSLPTALVSKIGSSRIRMYVQSANLFTITKYRGIDPEVNVRYQGGGADLTTGVDRGIYPLAQTFLAGLQLGF